MALSADPAVYRAISKVGLKCFQEKSEGCASSRCTGVACVKVLAENACPDALAILAEMKSLVNDPSGRAVVDKGMKRAADRANLHADDLDELAVPTYGLQP